MNGTIANFILGAIFVPLGVLIFANRAKVARMAIDSQRRVLGRNQNREGSSAAMAVVGLVIAGIGVALLVGSLIVAFSAK